MLPGDIRSMALKAAGHASDPDAAVAGDGHLVSAIESALIEVRRITVKEAAEIVRQHGPGKTTANLIEQLLPQSSQGQSSQGVS